MTKTYTALVTFERIDPESDHFAPEVQGAVGYMGISATDEDDLREALFADLECVGLRLLEIDEVREIDVTNLPDGINDHLAQNIQNWEPDARTVWGTIHTYLADGES